MAYIDQAPGEKLRESILLVYTDGCLRFMNAARANGGLPSEQGERYFALTSALQDAFPDIVAARVAEATAEAPTGHRERFAQSLSGQDRPEPPAGSDTHPIGTSAP